MPPKVLVNLAMSADGKISTHARRQVRISGPLDRKRVDQLKAGSDAIMVGIGTVLADDPSLTIKSPELRRQRLERGLEENPVRIVVDSLARTPPEAELLHKGVGTRIIAISEKADPARVKTLSRYAKILSAGGVEVDLRQLLEMLGDQGIRQLMVEGGGRLIGALFCEHLVDEFISYIGNIVIGGDTSPTPADGAGFLHEDEFVHLQLVEVFPLDEGVVIRWAVEKK